MSDEVRPFRVDQALVERAREKLVAEISRHVVLKKRGDEYAGLCPFHSERTPSFTVVPAKGFFHCFGCGARGDAIGFRMLQSGESFRQAVEALIGERLDGAARARSAEEEAASRGREEARRAAEEEAALSKSERAFALLREAGPGPGSPAERHLRGRGLTLPLPPTLRFHPKAPHWPTGGATRLPAMLAVVQGPGERPDGGHVVGAHGTFLDPASLDGERPVKTTMQPSKALLGAAPGMAVRLAHAGPELVVGEGIETVLSVMQATGLPGWAGISGPMMGNMWLPDRVRSVVIAGDADPVSTKPGPMFGKRPGEEYARRAAARFVGEGRRVRIAMPEGDKLDFNDLLQRQDA